MFVADETLDVQINSLMAQVTRDRRKSGFVVFLSGDIGTVRDLRGEDFYTITEEET